MTDDFDEAIRSRLHQPDTAPSGTAQEVLGVLRPAMRRARIKRSLAVGTATLSVLGVTGLGVAAITDSAASDPADIGILDGDRLPEPTPLVSTTDASDTIDGATVDSSSPVTDASTTAGTAAPATTLVAPTTGTPTVTQVTAPTPRDTGPPSATQPPPASPPVTANDSIPSNPSTAPTSSAPTTSPTTQPASGQRTISSNCGSITVSYTGDDISLVGTEPAAGFAQEVEDAGPEEVEVEFDNGDAECTIEAWMDAGTLRTDVENDDGDDD